MKETRQMLGALLGCGWTVDQVLSLSFEQMREVARCVYSHKIQMFEMVFDPIASSLGAKKKKSKSRIGEQTQRELRKSGLTPQERDRVLMERLNNMGFNL